MRSVLLIVSLVLVLSFAEAAGHHHPSRSPSTEIVRSKRLARWENTIDAIKCSLKIVAKEVASYHNNRLMCCGLWYMKDLLISKTQMVCDKPNETTTVFREMINDQLIYSDFAKSLLGNNELNCNDYQEDSPACEWLFWLIKFFLIVLIFTIVFITFGFVIAISQWYRWKQNYRNLIQTASADGADSEKAPWVAKGKRRLEKNGSMKRMYQLVEQPRQKVRNMINYIEHKGNIMTGKVEAPNDGRPRPHGRRTAGSRDSLHAGAILVETGNGGVGRTNNTATPTTDGGRCSSSASTESSTIASSEGTHGTTV